jgi:hypothetical protein
MLDGKHQEARMAMWLKCTGQGADAAPVYINTDMIISVTQRDAGARLMFGSGNAAYIDVTEQAGDIVRATGLEVKDA